MRGGRRFEVRRGTTGAFVYVHGGFKFGIRTPWLASAGRTGQTSGPPGPGTFSGTLEVTLPLSQREFGSSQFGDGQTNHI